jgi:Na+-translocating ferredoxin:NAD+ oxidoreductase subunit E
VNNIYLQDLTRGLVKENPVFRLLLGMCPLLAVTAYVWNGLGMGLAASAVLICSNLVISSIRRFIPERVRIPCYIVVIATFVTVVKMLLEAFLPDLNRALGVFVPLIVVNCVILGRAEAFAGKKPVLRSIADGVGMGIGFTLALVLLSAVREIFGSGTILGGGTTEAIYVFGPSFQPAAVFAQPAGAFIALGLLLALANGVFKRLNIT